MKYSGQNAADAFQQSATQAQQQMAKATEGFREYQLRMVSVAQANVNAMFEYMQDVLRASSISDVVEVSTSHSRRTLQMMADQARELTSAAQKIAGPGSRSGSS